MTKVTSTDVGGVVIEWAGERVELMPDRTAFRPSSRTLFVADVHLGKPASFRSRGVPVPDGAAARDLDVLGAAIERTGATRLVILGDFLHDSFSLTPDTLIHLANWRRRYGEVDVVLVRGNHDLHAGDPPDQLRIGCVPEPYACAGLDCRHHPPAATPTRPTIFGHIHPVVLLRGKSGRRTDRERAPVFLVGEQRLMMPAFGTFTGGAPVRPVRGDRVFAVGPSSVIEVPIAP